MIPKINRLRSKEDFKKILSNGKTSQNKYIRIKYIENNKDITRLGFIVGIKFAKKATIRNLVKRRLRAAARFLLKDTKSGFDIIVWPLLDAKEANYQALVGGFKDLFIKNDLLSF
jgi:ribonuclease P protein component